MRRIALEVTTIRGLLLGCLMERPMSGYDIMKYANEHLAHCYVVPARSQIYGELHRLEKEGYITTERTTQSNRPEKNICTITAIGNKTFLTWISQPMKPNTFKSPSLLQMYFSHKGSMMILKKLLKEHMQETATKMAFLANRYDNFVVDTQAHLMEGLTLRYACMQAEAEYNWLKEAIDTIPVMEQSQKKQKMTVLA